MRISRHLMFMENAVTASKRSTCYRRAVGAILVQHNNIVSIGYNGPASGEPHCTGKTCGGDRGCTRSIHAEKNVIDRALIQRVTPRGGTMYVTESPCVECAAYTVAAGIRALYYMHEYRIREGIDLLIAGGISVYRMTPSGYITDYVTGDLVEE